VTEAERPLHERLSIFDRPRVEGDVPPDPWRRGTSAELVRHAREDVGLPATVTFHDLRAPLRLGAHRRGVLDQGRAVGIRPQERQRGARHLLALFPSDEDRLRDAIQALHGPLRVGHVSRASGTTL
jgi:hypothetical protein